MCSTIVSKNSLIWHRTRVQCLPQSPTAAKSNYPRADKGSVQGLLARMYLNAEVYTGTARWADAKAACEAIFNMGYSLCDNYADLFRGDNGENQDAKDEMLWAVSYNAEQTQSYGGTSYLTLAAIASTDVGTFPNGVNAGWAGIRVPYEELSKYFEIEELSKYFEISGQNYSDGTYTVDNGDERAQVFYINGREESMEDALYVFLNGWSCLKFNNVPHDQTSSEFASTAQTKAYSDIDYPMIRLGEIYLIYAEACLHTNGNASEAMPYIQKLCTRAGVSAPSSITQDWLVAERFRELLWEGHRRTDLIPHGPHPLRPVQLKYVHLDIQGRRHLQRTGL